MMKKLQNIKDTKPNDRLITQLERALNDAKTGQLRSVIMVTAWDDDSVSHSWVIDARNTDRRLLSEMMLMQADFIVNIGLKEGDSILAKNL